MFLIFILKQNYYGKRNEKINRTSEKRRKIIK